MKHRIPHDLPLETARVATRNALESYRDSLAQYRPTGRWVTPDRADVSFQAAGRTFNGTVEVTPSAIVLELDVPLIFRPLRGIALSVIEDEIERWIARARAGEFDDAT